MKDKNGFELDPNLQPQENAVRKPGEGSASKQAEPRISGNEFQDKVESGYASFSTPAPKPEPPA